VLSFVGEAVALPVTVSHGCVTFGDREIHIDAAGLRDGPAKVFFRPADIAIASKGDAALEGRVESLRRTAAGMRATIAIDGYDQTLEIDSSLTESAALGSRIPLSLGHARIFPSETSRDEFNDEGEGI
jgi:sulfate transport system ATP-binding protein